MSEQPDFDRVAHVYRWAEYVSLGPLLQQTRTHFLQQLTDRRNALLFGDGDGRFVARLLQQNGELKATAVDTSRTMLKLLMGRSNGGRGRLSTWQGSALDFSPSADVDLVVTHFFLDCLTQSEVDALAQKIGAVVGPGTLWLVSDFGSPRARILKPFAAFYVRLLYFAFRVLTGLKVKRLPDPERSLSAAGFRRMARYERLYGLLYTELWQRQ